MAKKATHPNQQKLRKMKDRDIEHKGKWDWRKPNPKTFGETRKRRKQKQNKYEQIINRTNSHKTSNKGATRY